MIALLKIALAALLLLSITGCATTGVRVTEGRQETGPEAPRQVLAPGTAQIVHVDERERLVTFKHGSSIEPGFAIALNLKGEETAALKALEPRSGTGRLRTAHILEGEPGINDIVRNAGPVRAAELKKIYRDPKGEIN